MPRTLTLIAGNTSLKLCAFVDAEPVATMQTPTLPLDAERDAQLATFLRAHGPFDRAAAAVGRAAWRDRVDALLRAATIPAIRFVQHDDTVPFRIRYTDDSRMGPDRIANAAALRERFGAAAIAIDCGTATAITVLDANGDVAGGAILPGAFIAARALHLETEGRLPFVNPEETDRAIGDTTASAIRAGTVLAQQLAIAGMIARVREELGEYEAPAVVTGGAAPLYRVLLATVPHSLEDPLLTHRGLRALAGERTPRRPTVPESGTSPGSR